MAETRPQITSTPSVPDEARIAKINRDAGSTKQPYNELPKVNVTPTPAGRQFDRDGNPAR